MVGRMMAVRLGTYLGARVAMPEIDVGAVERRTQQWGRELLAVVSAQRESRSTRWRDALVGAMTADERTRARMLGLTDVLARLPHERSPRRTASLVREYLGGDLVLPRVLKRFMKMGTASWMPDTLVAWGARRSVGMMASKFIVDAKAPALDRALALLASEGRSASVDVLGEAVMSNGEADAYRDNYLRLIAELAKHPLAGERTVGGFPVIELSLKLSSLSARFNPVALAMTLDDIAPRLRAILVASRAAGLGITVDAEQYKTRALVWHCLTETLRQERALDGWGDVGTVLQAYHRDADDYLAAMVSFAEERGTPLRVRLVKGAYWDEEAIVAGQNGWPVPVFQDKAATDICFETLVARALERTDAIALAVASHNVRSHVYAEAVAESLGLPAGTIEHQSLYRTWTALSRSLGAMGWVARDYVPVGEPEPAMAYLVRRILENSSQVGFLSQSRENSDERALLAEPKLTTEDERYAREPHVTGFVSVAEARLFDPTEQATFAAELASARQRWGEHYPLRIGQQEVTTGATLEDRSPSYPDGPPVGFVEQAGPDEVERALAMVNEAQPAWAARDRNERADVLERAAQLIDERKLTLGAWVVHEAGRSWTEAVADVEEAADHLSWAAHEARASHVAGDYEPRGVVACIPPWNFPMALSAGMTGGALVTGNAVVLKPASETPITAMMLADVLYEAGVPREALVVLPGSGAVVGQALVDSPLVDMVAFTGSMEVGTEIYERAAQVTLARGGVKRVIAEMGGKNAIVVFPDADLDDAVRAVLRSAFSHAGQKCSACSRVLVHEAVADRFTERLVAAARGLPMGPADDPGTVVNPVVSPLAKERLVAHLGAIHAESEVLLEGVSQPGCLVGPTIVRVAPEDAATAYASQVEMFGPIVAVTRFADEDQAVELANNTPYGLTLGVFSHSPRTVERLVSAGIAGNVYVNRHVTGARVGIEPFGGMAMSGTGPKAGGVQYLRAFEVHRDQPRVTSEISPLNGLMTTGGHRLPDGFSTAAWVATPAAERARVLGAALDIMAMKVAVTTGELAQARQAIAEDDEIADARETVRIPGQRSTITWAMPRGVGLVAVDPSWDVSGMIAHVVGCLLAGNGLVLHHAGMATGVEVSLVAALADAGVPPETMAVVTDRDLLDLAMAPVHFAIAPATHPRLRELHRALSRTRATADQRWMKALVVADEAYVPGEAGFLRQFAQAKVVAINTMRHGAELGI